MENRGSEKRITRRLEKGANLVFVLTDGMVKTPYRRTGSAEYGNCRRGGREHSVLSPTARTPSPYGCASEYSSVHEQIDLRKWL